MEADQEDDAGLDMNPRQLEVLRETEGGVFLNLKSDPSTVSGLCHGDAVPVVTDEDGQGRASYTYCPTWQTHRKRYLAGKDGLTDPVEPEPVAMGVAPDGEEVPVQFGRASHEASDPWRQARRDLDLLAPEAGR
jgi:hypothetical protein